MQPLEGTAQAGFHFRFSVKAKSFLLVNVFNKSQVFLTHIFHARCNFKKLFRNLLFSSLPTTPSPSLTSA